MSQPAESTPIASTALEKLEDVDTFILRVLSPSAGATIPLSIRMTTTNTVKELKQKIRDSLPMQPSNERQRLIYQGRALSKEEETMTEIFGQERIRNISEIQTVHLVLRDPPTNGASSSTADRSTTAAASGNNPQTASAAHGPGPTITSPRVITPPGVPYDHNSTFEHLRDSGDHQHMVDRLPQRRGGDPVPATTFETSQLGALSQQARDLQTEAIRARQALFSQHQRAAMGVQGSNNHQFRASQPNRSVTYTQTGVGPNGERWNTTVTETTTTVTTNMPQGSSLLEQQRVDLDPRDVVQAILDGAEWTRSRRYADSPAASHAMEETEAAPRIVTNTNPTSVASSLEQPRPNSTVASAMGAGLTDPQNSLPGNLSMEAQMPIPNLIPTTSSTVQQTPNTLSQSITDGNSGPTVYILSSPAGPQALLIAPSQNGSESFFTPLRSSSRSSGHRHSATEIEAIARRERRRLRNARQHNHAGAPLAAAGGVPAGRLGHPHNPDAGAAMVQLWPHIWLVIRLMGFVWFFTSGSASWWRTIMVSSVAFIVFLYNTGIFNGVAAQVWNPIRGHLEALLPLAGPEPAAGAPAPVAGDNAIPNPLVGEEVVPDRTRAPRAPTPDPAQVAARLLDERRRADGNWLWAQVRRVEHATLLFLASLIPGVGERHIAARAAEENIAMEADRQREAAQAAAVIAENAATEGEVAEGAPANSAEALAEGNGETPVHREGVVDGNNDAQAGHLIDV